MAKLIVIETLGRIDKKPISDDGAYYEVQKVKLGEKVFFRRQKIQGSRVTSCAYAYDINAKRWISALYEM